MAIVLAVLVVLRALASPATTLAVASTYVNNVKIIASFNFHMIPGIIQAIASSLQLVRPKLTLSTS